MTEIASSIGPWVAIVALLIGIANTIAAWIARPGRELKEALSLLAKGTDDAIEALEGVMLERFKDHDRRVQRLEDDRPHQPTKEDLHALSLKMTELGTQMAGLSRTVDRMDRHLRENGK